MGRTQYSRALSSVIGDRWGGPPAGRVYTRSSNIEHGPHTSLYPVSPQVLHRSSSDNATPSITAPDSPHFRYVVMRMPP